VIIGAAPWVHRHEKGQELSVVLLLQSNMGSQLLAAMSACFYSVRIGR